MPSDPEEVSREERKALIARIKSSGAFRRPKDLRNLLNFLLEHCDGLLSADQIEEDHFGRPIDDPRFDSGHARGRILELKKCLDAYYKSNLDEPIKCEVPNASDAGGYQLRFRRLTESVSACRQFWAAHLASGKQVKVLCDPLLFFFDFSQGKAIRYFDTNIEGTDRETAQAELRRRKHTAEATKGFVPGHLYIDVGSVTAAEHIREYFRSSTRLNVPLQLEKQSSRHWLQSSPIVIGNSRTNIAIQRIFNASATARLHYRLHQHTYGGINIRNSNAHKDLLRALAAVQGPVDDKGDLLMETGLEIGIVSRIVNPSGHGAMTFICADGTLTTAQMAMALTNELYMRTIFARMGWQAEEAVPSEFELMFLVRLWPGDINDQSADPEFLGGHCP
jgi:hypothetical protein